MNPDIMPIQAAIILAELMRESGAWHTWMPEQACQIVEGLNKEIEERKAGLKH